MATDKKIQSLIHKLEEGGWARWLKLATLVAAVGTVFYLAFFGDAGFRGLAHPRAFEQAEIGREMARGHGFSTKVYRPAALFQLRSKAEESGKAPPTLPSGGMKDTYHGPLWPTVLAPFIWLMRDSWDLGKEYLYPSDRAVAVVAGVFFLLSVVVNYFLTRRLFDHRLAILAVGLLLVCDHFWQFSLSGLPQMMMLFLFSCAMYCLLRAVERREEVQHRLPEPLGDAEPMLASETDEEAVAAPPPLPAAEVAFPPGDSPRAASHLRGPLPWLIGAAFLFAALLLTHALTLWMFLGALLFCVIYFRPIGLYAGLMLAIVAFCYAPWMVRNYNACGSPFGVSIYGGLMSVRGTESAIMRSMDPPLNGLQPSLFRRKLLSQGDEQIRGLPGYLGGVIAAPFFFVALLHLFRRRSTSVFRWCVLLCWLGAFFGMSLFGLDAETLKANDLHVLFIPLTTAYGLAFILVLWSRLEIRVHLARVAFLITLFVISGHTFVITLLDLLGQGTSRVQWPPYLPPVIGALGGWTKESEVIMSDMPWAVAWYADRKALWVPQTIKDYFVLNDWDMLQGRIVGLYLTPISGNAMFLADIKNGEWVEWSPFIDRTAVLKNFPLKAVTPLTRDNMLVFYADRDRWTVRED